MQFKWCLGYLFAAMAMVLVPSKAHAQAGVEATLDDAIGVDSDADSEVDRGDTIKYRVRVRSTGDADAESVELTVPLGADLTLLPDSVMVGPISLDDASGVNQSGSVAISVLANDRDISLDSIKAMLASESMKLKTQKELAAGKSAPQIATPPTEPPGRAPEGQAYQR